MKRIDLFSIASAIGLISTAAFAQVFPNTKTSIRSVMPNYSLSGYMILIYHRDS